MVKFGKFLRRKCCEINLINELLFKGYQNTVKNLFQNRIFFSLGTILLEQVEPYIKSSGCKKYP